MTEPVVVCRNPNPRYHLDFPALAVAANGDVLILARQCGAWADDATFKFGRPLTFFEIRAEMMLLRSTDGGRSFLAESTLHTGLAYDPVLCALADGTMMAGMVVGEAGSRRERADLRGVLHRHLPQLDTVIAVRGLGVWHSHDDGRTWSAEPLLVSLPGWENLYNLRRPFQLADQTLIMPVTVGYPWRSRYVGLLRSWDGGASWADPSFVTEDPAGRVHYAAGVGYWQPAMTAAPNGDLLCVCVLDNRDSAPPRGPGSASGPRTFGPTEGLPRLVRAHSVDSGFTWSLPQDTGLGGDFPSLTTLPDGRLLLTYAQRHSDGSAVLVHLSEDGGVTWTPARAVRESGASLFYYPSSLVLADGALLTVCMTSQPGGVRVVEAVRWQNP